MGREIRRVPPGWEHPQSKEYKGYQPMYDEGFTAAAQEWLDNAIAWDNGSHYQLVERPELKKEYPFYWQWESGPPDPEYYRPDWTDAEATHYQMYENVSEGTPVSPVFATLDELKTWLVGQGYSKHAAQRFIETGYAPSMVVMDGQSAMNLHSFDMLPDKE